MKKYSYLFSGLGWLGFAVSLILIIIMDKCKNPSAPVITKETVVNNFYDSTPKPVPQISYLPGPLIPMPVPQDVDTAEILKVYFSRMEITRHFENDTISAMIIDSFGMNRLLNPGKFSYRWKIPMRTVESTTATISKVEPRKMQLLIGVFGEFKNNQVMGGGLEIFLQGKRGNLYGANYDFKNQSFGIKAAININEAFRNKKR